MKTLKSLWNFFNFQSYLGTTYPSREVVSFGIDEKGPYQRYSDGTKQYINGPTDSGGAK